MTKSLLEFMQESKESTIDTLAQYMENHFTKNWKFIFEENKDQLLDTFKNIGEPAYGMYFNFLLVPVSKQFKQAGLHPESRLPGDLDISREWGTNKEETDQHRCFWSTIHAIEGEESLGTIVSVLPHDHTRMHIPSVPQIFALTETNKEDIVEALSHRFAEFNFKDLPEFKDYRLTVTGERGKTE
jgi:hypothetical protein